MRANALRLAITTLAHWLVGGLGWSRIESWVRDVEESYGTDTDGATKRDAVLAIVSRNREQLPETLAGWAINLAIELAVAWLKAPRA